MEKKSRRGGPGEGEDGRREGEEERRRDGEERRRRGIGEEVRRM